MTRLHAFIIALFTTAWAASSWSAAPVPGAPLPELAIDERGELVMAGEDFSFQPWRSTEHPGTVHAIQYFGATMSNRDLYKPFTDAIEQQFEPGSVHVTTVLNLDAALWGTTGLVLSELKKNKRQYPEATMVVDEEGIGVDVWQLGEEGAGLFILDRTGTLRFFKRGPLDDAELASALSLIRSGLQR